jgi:hypothetical protein
MIQTALLQVFSKSTPAPIVNPINANPPDLNWLGPSILATGSILVALIGIVSLILGKRQDRKNKAAEQQGEAAIAVQPKITDGWEEVRTARAEATEYYKLYRTFENLFYVVFGALRHLARLFRTKNPDEPFDQDIVDALAVIPPDTDSNQLNPKGTP